MKTPPDTIYLQWFGVDQDELTDDDLSASEGDVCWCSDKIFDTDITYVRVPAETEEGPTFEVIEKMAILRRVIACEFDAQKAARSLKIAKTTIYRKLTEYGLSPLLRRGSVKRREVLTWRDNVRNELAKLTQEN